MRALSAYGRVATASVHTDETITSTFQKLLSDRSADGDDGREMHDSSATTAAGNNNGDRGRTKAGESYICDVDGRQ